ncbi:hypothetical protein M011DRAFT_480049 [Sporormia fimetaria CBS 119925]|uniref:RRM domain-containing protein n=1 Tax=Sporormia fimetaria CBS 119925 TaxID=1340428 RepID=A0A6A6V192_9PLEO|nr:hypothetical protein M011DRAFT_480049 [Sporormia fimetaria CBS 119925]
MDAMEGVVHSGGGQVAGDVDQVPIETIYINRLPERIKLEELTEILRAIFSHYGNIKDVVAKASIKRKGQAFVVFDNAESARKALEMDGFEFYPEKPMGVTMAKSRSDVTVMEKGTRELFDQHKRERLTAKERKMAEEAALQQEAPAAVKAERPRAVKTGAAAVPDEYVRPSRVLFLQNIPSEVSQDDLENIFEAFEGFSEIRYIPVRHMGFAEFENEQYAITAKEATANMPIGPDKTPMKVTYQRK